MSKTTPYKIENVHGSDSNWVVGKSNSETELFYCNSKTEALNKYIELVGIHKVVNAVNSHEALLEALKSLLVVTGKRGDSIWATGQIMNAEKAIEQAEGLS